jgi:hypothetical protein
MSGRHASNFVKSTCQQSADVSRQKPTLLSVRSGPTNHLGHIEFIITCRNVRNFSKVLSSYLQYSVCYACCDETPNLPPHNFWYSVRNFCYHHIWGLLIFYKGDSVWGVGVHEVLGTYLGSVISGIARSNPVPNTSVLCSLLLPPTLPRNDTEFLGRTEVLQYVWSIQSKAESARLNKQKADYSKAMSTDMSITGQSTTRLAQVACKN